MKNLFGNFEQKIVRMMNKFTEQLTNRLEKAENQIEALKMQNVEQAEKFLNLRKRWCSSKMLKKERNVKNGFAI